MQTLLMIFTVFLFQPQKSGNGLLPLPLWVVDPAKNVKILCILTFANDNIPTNSITLFLRLALERLDYSFDFAF